RINDYEERFSKVSKWYDSLLKDILVDRYDTFEAYRAAKELFYKDKLNFVAIDGTEYSKQMFDMIVFFAGAYSSEGSNTRTVLWTKGLMYQVAFLSMLTKCQRLMYHLTI
ncbi:MAG: hypothetical protein ACM3X1_00900, partial [Ignavibacteriales bacterium]